MSSINVSINAFGYGAGGITQGVGCLMLVDKESKLPLYFRAIPGDIADVSTLKCTIEDVTRLGLKMDSAILDAGYFCESNIKFLCERAINFVTRMPKSRKIFKQLVSEIFDIECHANAVTYGKRSVFIKSKSIELYENKIFSHVIMDPSKRASDIQNILKESNAENFSPEEIDEKIKYAGYFILISNKEINKQEILPTYYTRQNVALVLQNQLIIFYLYACIRENL